jgi:FkbM family methyltransferase
MNRYRLLTGRVWRAAKLGFPFWGTSFSSFPRSIWLNGKRIRLSAPLEQTLVNDVINIWLDDEYGLSQLANTPPKSILDLGANIGLFSIWARRFFPDAVIHAYEPNSRISEYARRNTADLDVRILESAVGQAPGRAHIRDDGDSRRAYTSPSFDGDIEMMSLMQIVDHIGGQVDLMKLDIEGAEWDLFDDPSSFDGVDIIRMEYHLGRDRTLLDIMNAAERLDFKVEKLAPNDGFGILWLRR